MEDQRPNNPASHPKFSQHYPQRDQCKSAQASDRQQKPKDLPPHIIRNRPRQRHPQQKTHLRRIERADVSLLHCSNLISTIQPVKALLTRIIWLFIFRRRDKVRAMAEIVEFVNRGAVTITPAMVEKLLRHLPQWKLEFTQIYEPLFPHLVDQLEFLADAVEDTAEGAYKDLPYLAFSQAVFALLYAHKKVGIIPDSVLNLGRADDSSVVRAVLIQNEKVFAIYAASQDLEWSRITSE